ncbi:MAG TPA: hypothetical protein VFB60_06910 [Ktedonobacteraceae bacterium]|nr:hypothetical protein [Ktedonobacteraceae bacterium]
MDGVLFAVIGVLALVVVVQQMYIVRPRRGLRFLWECLMRCGKRFGSWSGPTRRMSGRMWIYGGAC